MKRCDLFYENAITRENWPEDDLCDPPTEPRKAIHILIDELLGEDWYVAMPESDDQIITIAVYQIIREYVDERKMNNQIWTIIIVFVFLLDIIFRIIY